jgi:hypothetical protein
MNPYSKPAIYLAALLAVSWIGLWTYAGRPAATGVSSTMPGTSKAGALEGDVKISKQSTSAAQKTGDSKNFLNDSSTPVPAVSLQIASLQFRAAQQCRTIAQAIESYQSQIRACEDSASSADVDRRKYCAESIVQNDAKSRELLPKLDHCNASPEQREENYYTTMTLAARSGDTSAQLCWVEGRWHHEVAYDDYQSEAMGYVQEALNRGDWRFVALLAQHYVDNPPRSGALLVYAENPLGGQVTVMDFSVKIYRMNRLLRLGATGDYVQWLDVFSHAEEISPEQRTAADVWAQHEYAAHFASQPGLSEIPESCWIGLDERDREKAKHPWKTSAGS